MRTAPVRLVPWLLTSVVAAIAGIGCGGGSPASPTFTPTGAPEPEPGASTADAGISLAGDGSAEEVAAAFARCGTSPATGGFPADVAAVLSDKCQTCHTNPPLNGAPFPLLTYEDVHQLFAGTIPIYQEMYMLIQPGSTPHMPFGKAPPLTTDQFTTLSEWLLACALPGN